MENFAIITAGGMGIRMGMTIPKQFHLLNNKPVLMHTIEKFYLYDETIKIIVSLPQKYISYWETQCQNFDFNIKHKIVTGGETRFLSIKNSLAEVSDSGYVAIHDGVRPLIDIETIKRTFDTALEKGNAVACIDIPFSIRKIDQLQNKSVNRSLYKEIQTPQTFRSDLIKDAYSQIFDDDFTDDASVLEKFGESVFLVEGNRENIKITNKEDLIIANALINRVL